MSRRRNLVIPVLVLLSVLALGMSLFGKISGTVVCFGDSITNGARVDGDSWVYYLSQQHPDINFVNAGRNGRKTADKKEILPVLKEHPDSEWFLIFLGVNDLKDGTKAMVEQNVENMRWMINQVRQTNEKTKIVILAPTDINLNTMDSVNVRKKYNKNTKQSLHLLEKRYKKLAQEMSVHFVSLLDVVSPPNYVDGLHPDRKGQKEIAAAVWSGLKDLSK